VSTTQSVKRDTPTPPTGQALHPHLCLPPRNFIDLANSTGSRAVIHIELNADERGYEGRGEGARVGFQAPSYLPVEGFYKLKAQAPQAHHLQLCAPLLG
jgi:hypothetical protein